MITDRERVMLGKHPRDDVSIKSEEDSAPSSPAAGEQCLSQGKRRKYTTLSQWPEEWLVEFEAFKADNTEAEQRARFWSWEEDLQAQVMYACAAKLRQRIKAWKAAVSPAPQPRVEALDGE